MNAAPPATQAEATGRPTETPELYYLCKLPGLRRTAEHRVMTRTEANKLNRELGYSASDDLIWISARGYHR